MSVFKTLNLIHFLAILLLNFYMIASDYFLFRFISINNTGGFYRINNSAFVLDHSYNNLLIMMIILSYILSCLIHDEFSKSINLITHFPVRAQHDFLAQLLRKKKNLVSVCPMYDQRIKVRCFLICLIKQF